MKLLFWKLKKSKLKKTIIITFAILAILFLVGSSIIPFLSYLK